MSSERKSTRGAINAADLAVSEDDLITAEEALQKALRQVRNERDMGADNADD